MFSNRNFAGISIIFVGLTFFSVPGAPKKVLRLINNRTTAFRLSFKFFFCFG